MPDEYLPVYLDYKKAESALLIHEVWGKLVVENLWRKLFYDGRITDFNAFRKEMLKPGCLPFIIYGNGRLAAFSWLNGLEGKAARTHFAVFREFWGRQKRNALGRFLYRYILTLRDDQGYLFDCLYGITPATYRLAIRAALGSGWQKCGVIPNICFLAATNQYVDGVLTCATREILQCH